MQDEAATPAAEPAPWKPNSVEAAACSEPFQERFVTVEPFCAPFQRLVIEVPDGIVRVTFQPLIAELPAVTLTEPTKPPLQELTVL